jgi:hypothetical protein
MNRAPAARSVSHIQTVVPIDPANDFRKRRKWPLLGIVDSKKPRLNFDQRTEAFNHALTLALADLNGGGSISLVSFGVESVLENVDPEFYVILASSKVASRTKEIYSCKLHPEIRIAQTQASAIAVIDIQKTKEFNEVIGQFLKSGVQSIAAIPLFNEGRLYAMINAQLRDSMSEQVKYFLADLAAYSVELEGEIQELDFFSRIYRTMPQR